MDLSSLGVDGGPGLAERFEAAPVCPSAAEERPPAMCSLVIVDQDNVRAAMGWPSGKEFRERCLRWAAAQRAPMILLIEVDEGRRSERSGPHARLVGQHALVVYSGPRWRADDGIVRDVEWWLPRLDAASSVLVVSADKLVRRRCADVKQRVAARAGRVRFESGEAFGYTLPDKEGGPREQAADAPPTPAEDGEPTDVQAKPLDGQGTSAALPPPAAAPVAELCQAFLVWINETQPRPTHTASTFVHGARLQLPGQPQKRGSKRRLGAYR